MASRGHFTLERVAPGVIQERSEDGRLIVFRIEDGSKETVCAWADCAEALILDWPAKQPCLLLNDLHKSGMLAFSACMQDKLQELHQLRPELRRFVALVVPDFTADLARLEALMQELSALQGGEHYWKVFTARQPAMIWLLSRPV